MGHHYVEHESGTSYRAGTAEPVIRVLEDARKNDTRIRVVLGDPQTGSSWEEHHDVVGYVGRSCGHLKVPLLIFRKGCWGGGEIMTDKIIGIRTTRRIGGKYTWLYSNPKFTGQEVE